MRVVVVVGGLVVPWSHAGIAAELAYITSHRQSSVAVVDTAVDAMVGEIPLSVGSADLVVAPDGRTAYVVDRHTDNLTVVDLETRAIAARIPVGHLPTRVGLAPDGATAIVMGEPSVVVDLRSGLVTPLREVGYPTDVAFSADGRFAYLATRHATIRDGQLAHDALVVLDRATGATVAAVPRLHGNAIGVSPDGTRLFLLAFFRGREDLRLVIVAAETLAVEAVVPLGGAQPEISFDELVVAPDGATVYVAGRPAFGDGRVAAIDVATARERWRLVVDVAAWRLALSADGRRLFVGGGDDGVAVVETEPFALAGGGPLAVHTESVAIAPDGRRLYAAGEDGVQVIDAESLALLATVPGGRAPLGIAATADGSTLYVANSATGTVAVLDAATRRYLRNIETGGHPVEVALSPDGTRAYISNGAIPGGVFVVDTATDRVADTVSIPWPASALALTPDGARLLVSSTADGALSVIDTAGLTVDHVLTVAYEPKGIAVSPDGRSALVASTAPDQLRILDLTRVPPAFDGGVELLSDLATMPCGLAQRADASRVYVAALNGPVSAVDPLRRRVLAETQITVPFTTGACGIALSADERRVYVANTGNNLVAVFDVDLRLLHQIPVPPRPMGIALACPGGCPSPPPAATPTPTATPPPCVGDCDADGAVGVTDLVAAVGVAVGRQSLASCAAIDLDGDRRVAIDELIRAVGALLADCRGPA